MYSWGFGGLLAGFGLLECLCMWFACMGLVVWFIWLVLGCYAVVVY